MFLVFLGLFWTSPPTPFPQSGRGKSDDEQCESVPFLAEQERAPNGRVRSASGRGAHCDCIGKGAKERGEGQGENSTDQ
jgi:hypothetical protein